MMDIKPGRQLEAPWTGYTKIFLILCLFWICNDNKKLLK